LWSFVALVSFTIRIVKIHSSTDKYLFAQVNPYICFVFNTVGWLTPWIGHKVVFIAILILEDVESILIKWNTTSTVRVIAFRVEINWKCLPSLNNEHFPSRRNCFIYSYTYWRLGHGGVIRMHIKCLSQCFKKCLLG
jgi:hypothetical protein